MITYLINRINLSLDGDDADAFEAAKKRLRRLGPLPSDAVFRLYRRSVDARRKSDVHFVASVAVTGSFSRYPSEHLASSQISCLAEDSEPSFAPSEVLSGRPLIVGAGPAGLFCALRLAQAGYAPLVLERGAPIDERVRIYESFKSTRVLCPESNIQFGAGGAGTFSDGKLVTRISDPAVSRILQSFVDLGAPSEILWQAKPHVGTDILRGVVDALCRRIVSLGGEILYHTKVNSIDRRDGVACGVFTSRGYFSCGLLVLAVGNSANDLFRGMLSDGFSVSPKPFSVGLRIEHLQSEIDRAMYGRFAGHPALGHAEYQLSSNTDTRGVYTFCMCPGGEVVAAASEEGTVVVNGMSNHARDGENANSAIAVSIFPEDYGNSVLGAIDFRQSLEAKAYRAGGGRYVAPCTTVGDFLDGTEGAPVGRVRPSYLGGDVRMVSPDRYLPSFVTSALRGALGDFERRIFGFADREALLTGVETRTSCAVRITRDERRLAIGVSNLYPIGEGAGYAGGITSSAADGYRTALAILGRFLAPKVD